MLGMIRLNSPAAKKRTECIPERGCSHHFEIPGKKKNHQKEGREWNEREKARGRCWDSGFQHYITLNVYFVQFHSISFSSSVLVLNPVTTSEASKWKKTQNKTQCPEWEESQVHAHQSIWKCCSQLQHMHYPMPCGIKAVFQQDGK